jgi:hypothetical protein
MTIPFGSAGAHAERALMRQKFTATMLDIERLSTTRFEPFVPDWQTIDWSADRPDLAEAVADGYARDAERIRNLPQAPPARDS